MGPKKGGDGWLRCLDQGGWPGPQGTWLEGLRGDRREIRGRQGALCQSESHPGRLEVNVACVRIIRGSCRVLGPWQATRQCRAIAPDCASAGILGGLYIRKLPPDPVRRK